MLYCQLQKLIGSPDDHFEAPPLNMNTTDEEEELSTALFIPRKLWKNWSEKPLDGIKLLFISMDQHLHVVLRNMMKARPCFCNLYGLDVAAHFVRPEKLRPESDPDWTGHDSVVRIKPLPELAVQDRELLWIHMQQVHDGIPTIRRRFRLDPRVHIKCFTFESAWLWLQQHNICKTPGETKLLLRSYCSALLMRLLIRRESTAPNHNEPSDSEMDIPDEVYTFVSPWEVDARESLLRYMYNFKTPIRVELGWSSLRDRSTCASPG